MARLPLTLACEDYDRTRGLADGNVPVVGVDLNVLSMPVEEIFFRMLRYREFDAAEMSLSAYVLSLAEEDRPFVAIPVFPSRLFRHSAIYLNTAAGIDTPANLAGRRIGLPTYEMTAAVWIRGILQERYGVASDSPTYVVGGLHDAEREQLARLDLPANIRVEPLRPDRTLAQSLAEGELDAVYSARAPKHFVDGDPRVARLFSDFEQVEREYFAETRIFPVMHVVVLRREVYEANRWLARSLYDAFLAAQHLAYEALAQTGSLRIMLPWIASHLAETTALMGNAFWSYGLTANRHVFEAYLSYASQQGLNPSSATPDDLFAPETASSFAI
ncbi:MAG: transporter substrate-binding protein [Rhodoglobus sp.]|nr:transporter substrate-binding protein [Rhodoglobus sp.]